MELRFINPDKNGRGNESGRGAGTPHPPLAACACTARFTRKCHTHKNGHTRGGGGWQVPAWSVPQKPGDIGFNELLMLWVRLFILIFVHRTIC